MRPPRRGHRALLVLALQCGLAAAKKRKQPAVPAELLSGCPFHREKASPDELSEFGHELERDGRKLEAERCYARAIRSSPQAATGWFDLAAARQYSDQSAAIRYYRHGLKLRPSGAPLAPQRPASCALRHHREARGFVRLRRLSIQPVRRGHAADGEVGEPVQEAPPRERHRHRHSHRHSHSHSHSRASRRSAVARLANRPLFLATRRHAEAAQQFRTAARLQPADADALFNLGGSHELLEQPAEALHAYRGAPHEA